MTDTKCTFATAILSDEHRIHFFILWHNKQSKKWSSVMGQTVLIK